jgi:hypothetical protein
MNSTKGIPMIVICITIFCALVIWLLTRSVSKRDAERAQVERLRLSHLKTSQLTALYQEHRDIIRRVLKTQERIRDLNKQVPTDTYAPSTPELVEAHNTLANHKDASIVISLKITKLTRTMVPTHVKETYDAHHLTTLRDYPDE